MTRSTELDSLNGHVVVFDGHHYVAELQPSSAHDLWLWPAYARPPHDKIDSSRAKRAGRRVLRLDDRRAGDRETLDRVWPADMGAVVARCPRCGRVWTPANDGDDPTCPDCDRELADEHDRLGLVTD